MNKKQKEINVLFKEELTLARKGVRNFCVANGYKNHNLKQYKAIEIYCKIKKIDCPERKDQSMFLVQTLLSGKCEWINKNPKSIYTHIIENNLNIKTREGSFYYSKEWISIKNDVLRKYGRYCMKCKKSHVKIHVDHIKPRSKFPELELDFDNLQVLCKDCNMEKSNIHYTDYRPKTT